MQSVGNGKSNPPRDVLHGRTEGATSCRQHARKRGGGGTTCGHKSAMVAALQNRSGSFTVRPLQCQQSAVRRRSAPPPIGFRAGLASRPHQDWSCLPSLRLLFPVSLTSVLNPVTAQPQRTPPPQRAVADFRTEHCSCRFRTAPIITLFTPGTAAGVAVEGKRAIGGGSGLGVRA